jgi:hypothetical protein
MSEREPSSRFRLPPNGETEEDAPRRIPIDTPGVRLPWWIFVALCSGPLAGGASGLLAHHGDDQPKAPAWVAERLEALEQRVQTGEVARSSFEARVLTRLDGIDEKLRDLKQAVIDRRGR